MTCNPGAILWTKYVKPLNLCSAPQTVAHVIIGTNSKSDANKLIKNRIYTEGKHVLMRKTLADPKRCLKCQCHSHYTTECKASTDTCTRCAQNHGTSICPTESQPLLKCTNCKGEKALGYGTADRDCPIFIAKMRKLHQRNPENKYKFFPTDDPNTWKLLANIDDNTTIATAPQHQAPNFNTTHQPKGDLYWPYNHFDNLQHDNWSQHNRRGNFYWPPSPHEDEWHQVNWQRHNRHPFTQRPIDSGWSNAQRQTTLDNHFPNDNKPTSSNYQPCPAPCQLGQPGADGSKQ